MSQTMINSYARYYDAGFKAGKAMSHNDVGLYRHWKEWYFKAKALEHGENKAEAETAWTQGYHAGRNL